MPHRAHRACLAPRCRHYRPCPIHPQVETNRPSSSTRGYGAEWVAIRAGVLGEEPSCPGLERDGPCGAPTNEVDHVRPLRMGGTNARGNLRGACGRCHRKKSWRYDGARGNPVVALSDRPAVIWRPVVLAVR